MTRSFPEMFKTMTTAITPSRTESHTEFLPEPTGHSAEDAAEALFEAEVRALLDNPLRRPASTYRLQLHHDFTLDDVTRIVDYLADLGVSDCYLSPYLQARPGSTHGYDVFDYNRLNPEIGDEVANDRLNARLRERGMGRVLDVVPNHMGIGGANRFWLDLLETGPQSRSAALFEVDWHPVKEELASRVLLPILEDLYGNVLEGGLLVLERDGGSFWIRYHDHRLPLNPRTYARVLGRNQVEFRERFDPDDGEVLEYLSILDEASHLPERDDTDPEQVHRVRREKEVIKQRLRRLCERSPELSAFLDRNVASFQGRAGEPSSFDALHDLLEAQVYRLAYWRVAAEEINYRRFFDVTELAGVRAEDPAIFDQTHALIFRWVREGGVTGLRIDHPDGLADPLGYFRRLQERLFLQSCHQRLEAAGRVEEWPRIVGPLRLRYRREITDDPHSPLARRFPVVAEKILSRGETLPSDWPIDGTVGYEFLNVLNGLFVDPTRADDITVTYREFTGDDQPFADLLHECKLLIEDIMLSSELTMLARQLNRVAESGRKSRDFTLNDHVRSLREVMAGFRVYRTYLQPGVPVADQDREAIEQAVARARHRRPSIDESVYAFVRDVLLFNTPDHLSPDNRDRWEKFMVRFQQTTGPVQAKGLEDTAFYRQFPLVSLNEVGGDPTRFGVSLSAFHALNAHRLNEWPGGLSATATHDTKRGEDTRIRINVLSELADEWKTHLARWSRWNTRKKQDRETHAVPDAREEYLLYQTLIGAWPFGGPDDAPPPGFVERIQEYMLKAVREAKRNTSWTDPDPSYGPMVQQFVVQVLEGPDAAPFLNDFLPFQRRIARVGVIHSLSQTLLKLTSPGVPDIYQGCELWDFSLVDPDNRRPVDYETRKNVLARIRAELDSGRSRAEVARALLASPEDGAIKLYFVWTLLNRRRADEALFQTGSYRPLETVGARGPHVVAFLRQHQGRLAVVIAPRLVSAFMGQEADILPLGRDLWGETQVILPEAARADCWRNVLTDEIITAQAQPERRLLDLAEVFATLPFALLVEEGAPDTGG